MSRLTLAILPIVLVAACGRKPEPPPAETPAVVKPKVTVLNADSLVIDGKHYRLANGFAPQAVPDARCWAEAVAAKQATRVVVDLVDKAAIVEAAPTGQTDEYNRQLATVRVDGADLGQVLFQDGLVARPPKGRFDWCDPVSAGGPGAPDLTAVMEVTPARAPVH